MNRRQFFVISLIVLFLTACTAPATPSPTVTSAPTSTETPPPTTIPTPEPTATPTTTPTPTPMPTPTPIPWTLESAIAKLPEVYAEAVTPETVEQYTQLLSALSEEAQWWITGMGWGLEDLELDANEVALLELLPEKNVPTVMSILTSPDIINGVTGGEVTWAQGYEAESLSALLQDDIDELLAQGLLSDEGLAGIKRLIEMASTDFEIAKGLYPIDNFGHPDPRMFTYSVPDYNTQLYVLGQLVEQGLPEGYDVAAVAAALDYGSLWTIADEQVRAMIPGYAKGMVDFQAETDPIIKQYGATWRASDLPLEGQITLVWGAPGILYPAEYSEWQRHTNGNVDNNTGPLRSFLVAFRSRPMNPDDFEWAFITLETKEEMRDYLIDNGFLDALTVADPDRLMERIWNFYYHYSPNFIYVSDPGWPNSPAHEIIDGRDVHESYLGNIEEQWRRFVHREKFRGSSGDAYIGGYLIQALNMPNISMGARNHTSGYFNPHSSVFRVTAEENRTHVAEKAVGTEGLDILGWWQVPWNNFRITHPEEKFRLWFTKPLPYTVGKDGIPPGYIYRANVAYLCDLPNYCD